MRPIEKLKDEHQVILRVLKVMEQLELAMQDGADFPGELLDKAIDFATVFADRCHHCKEEGQLFPVLVNRGIPNEGGPIGCMMREHSIARGLTGMARDALPSACKGDLRARACVRDSLANYVELLKGHIAKEDNSLFNLAEQVMSDQDKEKLTQEFDIAESKNVGCQAADKYRNMVDELEKEAEIFINSD